MILIIVLCVFMLTLSFVALLHKDYGWSVVLALAAIYFGLAAIGRA